MSSLRKPVITVVAAAAVAAGAAAFADQFAAAFTPGKVSQPTAEKSRDSTEPRPGYITE